MQVCALCSTAMQINSDVLKHTLTKAKKSIFTSFKNHLIKLWHFSASKQNKKKEHDFNMQPHWLMALTSLKIALTCGTILPREYINLHISFSMQEWRHEREEGTQTRTRRTWCWNTSENRMKYFSGFITDEDGRIAFLWPSATRAAVQANNYILITTAIHIRRSMFEITRTENTFSSHYFIKLILAFQQLTEAGKSQMYCKEHHTQKQNSDLKCIHKI